MNDTHYKISIVWIEGGTNLVIDIYLLCTGRDPVKIVIVALVSLLSNQVKAKANERRKGQVHHLSRKFTAKLYYRECYISFTLLRSSLVKI